MSAYICPKCGDAEHGPWIWAPGTWMHDLCEPCFDVLTAVMWRS